MARTRQRWLRAAAGIAAVLAVAHLPAATELGSTRDAVDEALDAGRRLVETIRRVETTTRQLGDFRVPFRQSRVSAMFGAERETTERGVLFVAADGRMRFEYEVPEGQIGVFDGHVWWLVVPEDRQVLRHAVAEGEWQPLDLLTGRIDVLETFAVAEVDATPSAEGLEVLELIPREPNESVEAIVVEIDPSTSWVVTIELVDALGGRETYRFGAPQPAPPRPDAFFRIRIPPGYDVVDA